MSDKSFESLLPAPVAEMTDHSESAPAPLPGPLPLAAALRTVARFLPPLRAGACARLALAMYAAFVAATWHARYSVEPWGPLWAVKVVHGFWGRIMRLCGVESRIVLPRELVHLLEQGQLTPSVVSFSPHGAMAVGHILCGIGRQRLVPELQLFRPVAGIASVLFNVPLVRETLLLFGARDAKKSVMDAALASGRSVALNTGGIWEQLSVDDSREALFLQPNLGFIRLALRHAVPIIPSYAFGESQLYRTSAAALGLRQWLARRFRVGIPAARGQPFGLPLPLPVLPYPTKWTYVVGRPVATSAVPVAEPTEEQVREVLARWEDEVLRLFNEHKDELLPPHVAQKGLTISSLSERDRAGAGSAGSPRAAAVPVRSRL